MTLPAQKTKIVATIGPASESPEVMERLICAGMGVARLNFSHGDFDWHGKVIRNLREVAAACDRPLAVMADLPGPKIRIGNLADEPIELAVGDEFTLTVREELGDATHASVSFQMLPQVVKPGETLFLNDGSVQLQVVSAAGEDVHCRVVVGGELRSRKGLNLPSIDLGISAFTIRDRECLEFALGCGVDAISQSFVESAADIQAVRRAADGYGAKPFILAKIERARALDRIDEIVEAADGIMVARGDLGVEVQIERIAVIQKELIRKAMEAGKPVITATQMLESMTYSRLPTRAEATDVANAILDGTDCVMLSGESATGRYPVEAVRTLARIAGATEPHRRRVDLWDRLKTSDRQEQLSTRELLSISVEAALEFAHAVIVVVPAYSGTTARSVARFRLPIWIVAPCQDESTFRQMQFTYGVEPVQEPDEPEDWSEYAREWVRSHGLPGDLALVIQGPYVQQPQADYGMKFVKLNEAATEERD